MLSGSTRSNRLEVLSQQKDFALERQNMQSLFPILVKECNGACSDTMQEWGGKINYSFHWEFLSSMSMQVVTPLPKFVGLVPTHLP